MKYGREHIQRRAGSGQAFRHWRRAVALVTLIVAFGTTGEATEIGGMPDPFVTGTPELAPPPPEFDSVAVEAVRLAAEGKHDKAKALVPQITDAAALRLIEWLGARSSRSGAGFEEIAAFLSSHADWPQIHLIAARAEAALYSLRGSPERALQHFAKYPAQTGWGMIAHARALSSVGKPETAARMVRSAWRDFDFGAAADKRIRAEFKTQLTGDDHRARMVRQLYEQRTTAAARTAAMISTAHVKMVQSAAALFRGHRRALRQYLAVPAELRRQAVMQYALTRYHRRRGKSDKAREIALKAPGEPKLLSHPQPWWDERWALIRTTLYRDKPEQWPDAYQLAKAHGFQEGTSFVQGEFMAGWIALRFLKKPRVAKPHFELILERDSNPLNVAQAHYWLARTYRALEDEENAKLHLEAAAEQSTTFYGQLALGELGLGNAPLPLVMGPDIVGANREALSGNELARATKLLAAADQRKYLPIFFIALAHGLESAEEQAALAALAAEMGEIWISVRVAKISGRNGIRIEQFSYPKDALPMAESSRVEPALIYAVSRQESEFNPRAVSHAGALGLMQMMPGTARHVTRKLGLEYRKAALLDQPSYNVTLGTSFLGDLLQQFDGSYISTIAGYNAGPGRVAQWNERYGSPLKGEIEPVDWIESIPFNETRNYVKRVLESVQVYRTLFGVEPLVPLTADLMRGNEQQSQAASGDECIPQSTIESPIACN